MYDYQIQKARIFSDDGQKMFLRVRDFAGRALKIAGAVRSGEMIGAAGAGDSWDMLACIDRMVELGELRELTDRTVAGQCRVFVRANE